MSDPTVDILLGTYNGEAFLRQQLDSLLGQEGCIIHIIARDDGSTDQTVAILQEFREKYPEKLTLLPSERNLGVIQNFATLLAHSSAPYIAFADQDDVWMPDKVAQSAARLQVLEQTRGVMTPLLVHTDLRVVDRDLHTLSNSFWNYARIGAKTRNSLGPLLIQNNVTGCAMMINRSLANWVPTIPKEALMHDHWIALVAATFGAVDILDQPLIQYRQHGNNQVGAKPFSSLSVLLRGISKMLRRKEHAALRKKGREGFFRLQVQAEALLREYGTMMPEQQRATVEAFISLPQQGIWKRTLQTQRFRLWRNAWVQRLGQLSLYLHLPKTQKKPD